MYNKNIFYRTEKEDFKYTFLHISLDLSGSMRGEKLGQTIQTAIAIAYAACNLKSFDVEISLRGTFRTSKNSSKEQPLLAYAFDSRKHSVKNLYKFTVDGMGLEAIYKPELITK